MCLWRGVLSSSEFTKAPVTLSLSPCSGNQLSVGAGLKQISSEHISLHPGVPLMNDISLTAPPLYCPFYVPHRFTKINSNFSRVSKRKTLSWIGGRCV